MQKIVLLPGMDGTGDLFQPFIEALGDRWTTQIVRYPTDRALGYKELEDIVRSVLPPDGPFVLLGESFSGPIAVSIAASPPAGLCGLVLCCTFVRNPRPALSVFGWLVNVLSVKLAPRAAIDFFMLGRYSNCAARSALTTAIGQLSAPTLRARLRAILSIDISSALTRLQIPVLYLRATDDRLVPARSADQISGVLPAMVVADMPGPHSLLQACPVSAADAVAAFLRRVHGAL